MEDSAKTYLFEKMPIIRAVLTLAIPTVLSSLVMVLYSIADTYFVGMLGDAVQNASVTLASTVLLAFNAVNNLFGVGTSSAMSRALGRYDHDTVRRSSAFGFYCSVFCGLMFSLLCTVFMGPLLRLLGADGDTEAATRSYMLWTVCLGAAPSILNVVMAYMVRAEGSALHASIGTMSGCLLNIVLDPIFILPWGLNMGAAGAGMATFISNCVACGYFFLLLYIKRGRTYVCIDPRLFRAGKAVVLDIFGVGIPSAVQNLLNVTSMTLLNNFTAAFGASAVAAMGISYRIYMVPMQIALGSSQGIMPMVGYNYASGDHRRMKKSFMFAIEASTAFMTLMAVLYYFGSGTLVRFFMEDAEIVAYGSRFLRGFCLAMPFICIDFSALGAFQSFGKGKYALVFAILRKAVLEIPALCLLNWLFPLYGLPYAQVTSEVIVAAAAVISMARFMKKLAKRPDAPLP